MNPNSNPEPLNLKFDLKPGVDNLQLGLPDAFCKNTDHFDLSAVPDRGATSSSIRGGAISMKCHSMTSSCLYSTMVQLFRKRSHIIIIMYFCPQTRSPQYTNTHILLNAG